MKYRLKTLAVSLLALSFSASASAHLVGKVVQISVLRGNTTYQSPDMNGEFHLTASDQVTELEILQSSSFAPAKRTQKTEKSTGVIGVNVPGFSRLSLKDASVEGVPETSGKVQVRLLEHSEIRYAELPDAAPAVLDLDFTGEAAFVKGGWNDFLKGEKIELVLTEESNHRLFLKKKEMNEKNYAAVAKTMAEQMKKIVGETLDIQKVTSEVAAAKVVGRLRIEGNKREVKLYGSEHHTTAVIKIHADMTYF